MSAPPAGWASGQNMRLEGELVAECVEVSKRFKDIKALDKFSLQLRRGTICAILGRNGAGKTTAIKILTGLISPDAGRAQMFGRRPGDPAALARIGCQLQRTSVYPLARVGEVADVFGSYYARQRDSRSLIDEFGLRDRRDTLFRDLSGGERQRLALVLAFINDPECVILDEPSVALDVEARAGLWAMLRRFRDAGGTVLLATHLLEEAEALADVVAIVSSGRVVVQGTRQDLIEQFGGASRLELWTPKGARKAAALTEELGKFWQVEERDGVVLVSGGDRDVMVREVLDGAARHHIDVPDFRLRSGSLAEVFMRAVGGMGSA